MNEGDGNYSGILGMIHRNEADFGLAPYVLRDRGDIVRYSPVFLSADETILSSFRPYKSKFIDLTNAFRIYNTNTWFCLSLFLVLIF